MFSGYHLHSTAPQFFGVAALLLTLWMLAIGKTTKTAFWSVYVVVGFAAVTFAQPFGALMKMLLSPVSHPMGREIMFMVGIPILAAFGGMSIERCARRGEIPRVAVEFVIFAISVLSLFVLLIIMRNIPSLAEAGSNWARGVVGAIILLVAALILLRKKLQNYAALFGGVMLGFISICSLSVVLFWSNLNSMFVLYLKNMAMQLSLFCAVAGGLLVGIRGHHSELKWLRRWGPVILFVLLSLCMFVVLYPWNSALRMAVPHFDGLILAGLGALRAGLGVLIFFLSLSALKLRKLPFRAIYVIVFALVLFEQVPASKVHAHMNASPFYAGPLYPPMTGLKDIDGKKIDLADYRVNLSNAMLRLPFYEELFGQREICSSTNVAYGIRSYGGYTDVIPRRIEKFAKNWGRQPIVFCIYDRKNSRFLDLTSTGYQYELKSGQVVRRPTALSRFMLFKNFAVIGDGEKELARLKAPGFNPKKQLLIEHDPGFASISTDGDARNLSYKETGVDHIELKFHTKGPAILLFDDSFDSGWHAKVNGRPVKILVANYAFMALPVSGGSNDVDLSYDPQGFWIGAIFALVGLAVLVIAGAVYMFRRFTMTRWEGERVFSPYIRKSALTKLCLLFLIVAVAQIVSGGVGRLLGEEVRAPIRWTISYMSSRGERKKIRVLNPVANEFNEGRTKGPIEVLMEFRECLRASHYRFWVGPYGSDSTQRQPVDWSVYIRADEGGWTRADVEQVNTNYHNDSWYQFPLHTGGKCVRKVRWEINRIHHNNDLFRLFAFQLF